MSHKWDARFIQVKQINCIYMDLDQRAFDMVPHQMRDRKGKFNIILCQKNLKERLDSVGKANKMYT